MRSVSTPIPITDPDDPRIADYTSVRERDLTGREGKFIVEGKVTLEVFLTRSRFRAESLFLSETRLGVFAPLLKSLPDDIPVYTASQSVMDTVAGFPIHRGILACGQKDNQPDLKDWLSKQSDAQTLVVCIGLSNHDNAGSMFRNAAALGASGVILDETTCDPLYRKSIRVSAGTALWLPFHHGARPEDIVKDLKDAGYDIWTLTPRADATSLYAVHRPERLAVILGAEGPGLSDEMISGGTPVRIPMANDVDSLNVATCMAIVLSHRFSGK
jgi:tRNA G18 (ribose-2'-O)-methylase SpoU